MPTPPLRVGVVEQELKARQAMAAVDTSGMNLDKVMYSLWQELLGAASNFLFYGCVGQLYWVWMIWVALILVMGGGRWAEKVVLLNHGSLRCFQRAKERNSADERRGWKGGVDKLYTMCVVFLK